MITWLEFLACAVAIMYAGVQLTKHGDVIAERTGLGRSWVGLVLLATVTSLPELMTGISSVTFNNLPNLAVSGTVGSCMFNVLVIAALDLLSKNRPVSHLVHQGHMLSAGFGIVLLGLVVFDILFGKYLPVISWLNSIDPISLLFVGTYLLGMKLTFNFERQRIEEFVGEVAAATDATKSLSRSVLIFVVNAIVIVTAAFYLPELAEQIAKSTGLGESFIGSSLIAITTSLPEITVSVASARMGAFDMAVANLLGSNLFNVLILSAVDLAYQKGALLRSVSQINALTALTAIIATGIVVIGLTYRSEKKFLFIAGDALAILVLYVLANIVLFIAS